MKPTAHMLVMCALVSIANSALAEKLPNIVIIMPDDVGYGDFGCHGNPIIQTPHIDALHKQSVRFTDFHVSPTCAPTRSALITGRHEFKSGVTHTIFERERLSPKAITLPEVLKRRGYSTGIFGKWHLGDEDAYLPDKRGFDEYFIHGAGGINQTFPGSCGDAPNNSYFDPTLLHNGNFQKTRGYCTNLFFYQAANWIEARIKVSKDQPFFAMITPNAAHEPLDCPSEYADRYIDKVPENVAKFFGMIVNIDENVGLFLKRLDEWGLAQDTLVIFLTDNGGTNGVKIFNAGMRGAKVTPYQGGTRVPSFWRWPAAIQGGRDISELSAHLDILPTLAEITKAEWTPALKAQVEGRSLLPLLKNPSTEWPNRYLVTHVGRWPKGQVNDWKFKGVSIRDARFTLVNNTELYDLKADPGETTNVSAKHPEDLSRLRTEYEKWWVGMVPMLENEDVVPPKINPLKAKYWAQFGGGPDAALLKRMDPTAGANR